MAKIVVLIVNLQIFLNVSLTIVNGGKVIEESNKKCNGAGCGEKAFVWYYPALEEEKPETASLCEKHAIEQGFCQGCACFLAGSSEWEESKGRNFGYCQECWEDIGGQLTFDSTYGDRDEDWY